MRSLTKIYTIIEYGGFVRGGFPFAGYQSLPERTFDALELFILANHSEGETGAIELLSLSVRRGVGKLITARNYVGLITMKDGAVIEILPKIHNAEVSEIETKRIDPTTFAEGETRNINLNIPENIQSEGNVRSVSIRIIKKVVRTY